MDMTLICFAVCLFACTVGSICGVGGGIIIKPVLDLTGVASASATSLLSGSTVLAMSLVSIFKRIKGGQRLSMNTSVPIAVGAAVGGLVGKVLFKIICQSVGEASAGVVQNAIIFLLNACILIYTIYKKRIKGVKIESIYLIFIIGVFLGCFSSLLGIGGGPIDLVALGLLMQMDTKDASFNALFIIAISQTTSLVHATIFGGFDDFSLFVLMGMVLCGIAGGSIGSTLYSKMNQKQAQILFEAFLVMIMIICALNVLS